MADFALGSRQAISDALDAAIGVFSEVRYLLLRGIEFAPNRRVAFENDLRELLEPSLPILIHKRAKFLAPYENGFALDERWRKEIVGFMDRVLSPSLGADRVFVERNWQYVGQKLDALIAAEQQKRSEPNAGDNVPLTSRFDSSWAI